MANYTNVFFGFLTFLGASMMAYGLWVPTMNVINSFPTELFVLVGGIWITYNLFAIAWMPFMMMVSDDRGM